MYLRLYWVCMRRMIDRRKKFLALAPHLAVLLAERHVSRAALRAGISQPSMSRALAGARALFDDELLVSSSTGGLLTARGKELERELASILRDIDGTVAPRVFVPKLAEGVLGIAATDYVAQIHLPRFAARLQREAPHVTLQVSAWGEDALARLGRDELQFGMNPLAANAPRGFFRRRIASDRFVVAMAETNEVASHPKLTLERYLSLSHILTVTEGGEAGTVDIALGRRGKRRRIAARVSGFETALALVSESALCTTVPEQLARRWQHAFRLVLRPPPLALPEIEISLIWHERRHKEPLVAWARSLAG